METKYIREFVAIAEHSSFSKAATELYISQSSLSKHIKTLESDLGVHLFNRSTRDVTLTPAGTAFLPYAMKMVSLLDTSQSMLRQMSRVNASELVIGVIQNAEYYHLAKYMILFQKEFPNITFSLLESDEAGLLEMYRKGMFRVFTAFTPSADKPKYNYMPMVESRFMAMYHVDEAPAGKESITLQDLAEEKLLLPAHGSTMSRIIQHAFENHGILPRVLYEGSSHGCIDLVREKMGVSIHSVEFAEHISDDKDIVALPIEPCLTFTYGIGSQEEEALSAEEKLFLSHMERYRI